MDTSRTSLSRFGQGRSWGLPAWWGPAAPKFEPVLAKLDGIANLKKGETVHLGAPTRALHVFDADGKAFHRRD